MLEDGGVAVLSKYLSLAEIVSGAEAASLCVEATGDPSLHVFGDLLDAPSIAALASTPHEPSLDLLRLFAYDTYAEYSSGKQRYPELSEAHIRKLRRLSVVSLANQSNIITYDQLRTCLEVTSVREVEDAVLDAVYVGLIRARLDQRAELVEIISAVGRDVVPHSGVTNMHNLLSNWASSAEAIVQQIDQNIARMKQETAAASRERLYVEQMASNVRADVASVLPGPGSSRGRGPGRSRDRLPGSARGRGPGSSFDRGPGSARDRGLRRHGSSGPGGSSDGWHLPGSRSIRSRFEM